MAQIGFYDADKSINFKRKKIYKYFFQRIFSIEEVHFKKVSFIFCSDNFLLELNKQYLQHDFYTDVLTFSIPMDTSIQGDIYISIDRIKENAKIFCVSYQNELLRVMIHGVLHLCGYNDNSKNKISVMRQKEDFFLKLFNSDFT